ncbi:MAG: hypothetical protein M1358_12680 [Chloroflexi bacterium]|nr:hypothetical protein [Chloroflexota bacterium]
MDVTPKRVRCANCGIEIKWAAIEKEGRKYCWEGCADGDPVPIRLPVEEDVEEESFVNS